MVERLPPHNIEAEEALLGSIMIDREAIALTLPFLHPEDFYRSENRVLYQAALALYDRNQPTDFVTLSDELERQGKLEEIGGAAYLASLSAAVPTAVHAEAYGRIVQRCAILRNLIKAAERIAGIAYEGPSDVEEALDRAEQAVFTISQRPFGQGFVPLRAALKDYLDELEYLHGHQGETPGLATGFADLDKLTGGLHPSDLIVVAGRPSVGKTGFALTIAHHAGVMLQQPVAVFSLEMSTEQLVHRLICAQAGVDSHNLRTGRINDEEWGQILQACEVLSEAPIYIDDTANIDILELRSKARRLKSQADIKLVVVDYLQLMRGRRGENRVQEVSEISRSLKGLARDLGLPVIALSQLSRAIEARQDHRPLLSDLRESGAIEQDADLVLFIHREELYKPDTDRKNLADIIVAKHRHGPVGQVSLRFFPRQTRFLDLAKFEPQA
ncbi:MAG: replicative DNA helicase [Chloroflexi bacterium]|nr:replicative DNA helicase [Chloroflexota bacterium]